MTPVRNERTTEEILATILAFARRHEDIDYVLQNGSRVNPNIVADRYADYDIIFGCSSPRKYQEDQGWILGFGEPLIMQLNELEGGGERWPVFLVQFADGSRLDMQFHPGDPVATYRGDSLSRVLLDKRNLFTQRFEPSEDSYITGVPGEDEYLKTLNEFWWCVVNVAKGIARNEITYSHFMYDSIVRECLLRMLSWYAGSKHGWNVNTGKFGKFLGKYLDAETWTELESTYETDTAGRFRHSLHRACGLADRIDREVRGVLRIPEATWNAHAIVDFLYRIERDTPGEGGHHSA